MKRQARWFSARRRRLCIFPSSVSVNGVDRVRVRRDCVQHYKHINLTLILLSNPKLSSLHYTACPLVPVVCSCVFQFAVLFPGNLYKKRFRPIVRQSNTHQRPRLGTTIGTRIRQRRKDELVDGEVEVTVFSDRELHERISDQ